MYSYITIQAAENCCSLTYPHTPKRVNPNSTTPSASNPKNTNRLILMDVS